MFSVAAVVAVVVVVPGVAADDVLLFAVVLAVLVLVLVVGTCAARSERLYRVDAAPAVVAFLVPIFLYSISEVLLRSTIKCSP